jgi:uncharacterized membrane protein
MTKKRYILSNNLRAGINAVLPLIIFIFLLGWVFRIVFKLIEPVIIILAPRAEDQTIFIKLLALVLVLLGVTIIGSLIRSKEGRKKFNRLENRIFKILPGYTMVKETLLQFLGTKRMPFSTVAIVRPFNNETRQIGFITNDCSNGFYTVFVPTGPNPTSGNIFHLKKEQIQIVDVPYEQAMKTIIACGIDSAPVFKGKIK